MQSLKRRPQFPRVGIAFGAFAALANHVEQVALAVAHAGDEAPPVALIVSREQARIVALATVELADHVHGMRVRRPYAESGALGYQVRAHGCVRGNVLKRSWHGQFYSEEGAMPSMEIPGWPPASIRRVDPRSSAQIFVK